MASYPVACSALAPPGPAKGSIVDGFLNSGTRYSYFLRAESTDGDVKDAERPGLSNNLMTWSKVVHRLFTCSPHVLHICCPRLMCDLQALRPSSWASLEKTRAFSRALGKPGSGDTDRRLCLPPSCPIAGGARAYHLADESIGRGAKPEAGDL